ncbi:MAG: DUF2141 domain-containing protein [Alphaproteobacteria bacterium]
MALLFALAEPAAALAVELTITVENVRNDNGVVRLSVYASRAEWPDKSTKDHDQVKPARPGSMVFKFDVPPGIYAVNAYHDETNSNKFATNFFGMPLEGYGFSNDVRPKLSAPSFNSAAFELTPAGGVISFGLVYP